MAKSIGKASLAACPAVDLAPRKQVMADLSREGAEPGHHGLNSVGRVFQQVGMPVVCKQ